VNLRAQADERGEPKERVPKRAPSTAGAPRSHPAAARP
jgi:hypothetical protein